MELLGDRRSEEDRVVGIHKSACPAVAEYVHQGEAREVGAVCASLHDGVTAEVCRQAEYFSGFHVGGIVNGLFQEGYDELDPGQRNFLDFLEGFRTGAVVDLETMSQSVKSAVRSE